VQIGTTVATTFDGRPALTVMTDPGAGPCGGGDFHLMSGGIGPGSFVELRLPSRLTVTDLGGMTIVIQVWACPASVLPGPSIGPACPRPYGVPPFASSTLCTLE
jgi:hypothetical protein